MVFLKINGPQVRQLADLFGIKGYPSIAAVTPASYGKPYSFFSSSPRDYETIKKWMVKVLDESNIEPKERETS